MNRRVIGECTVASLLAVYNLSWLWTELLAPNTALPRWMVVCMMVMMFGSLYIIGRALYRWRQQGWLKRKVDVDDAFTDVDVDVDVGVGVGRLSGTVGSGVRIRCGKSVVDTNATV